VSNLRKKNGFHHVYGADETAVWLDASGGKCIEERGAKEVGISVISLGNSDCIFGFQVSVLTTGHDKMRVTVMLTSRLDSFKCKPYVLLPRKRRDARIDEKYKNKLILAWAGKIWMDDEWTADYLQRVLGTSLFAERLLVWDSFRCHISESTKKQLRQMKLQTAIVPGGCTKFVQVRHLPR